MQKKKAPEKELKVAAIENGTVIDHIPADSTFKVAEILKLDSYTDVVSVASNLSSSVLGRKGLVKVAGKYLTEQEFSKISIVAPQATVNIIRNYQVKEKIKVNLPDTIDNVIKCSNPVCITNNEEILTKFYITRKNPLKVKCHYCEREMEKGDIKIV